MKLSENTISVLKSFSGINQSIMLKQGKVQRTLCPEKIILAEVELEDEFPIDFGIYDLGQFLGNIATMNNPDLTFSDKSVVMFNTTDQWELEFGSCAPALIQTPPDKNPPMNQVDISLSMTTDMIQKIIKVAAINSWSHMTISSKKGKLKLIAHEKSNKDSGKLSKELTNIDYSGGDFAATFKISNLKIIPDDYDIEILLNGFAKFVSKNKPLKYFIALESSKE